MFEQNIQKAWKYYKEDLGLGRMAVFISFYNLFLFFLGFYYSSKFVFNALIPIFFSFTFFYLRPYIVKKGMFLVFLMNAIMVNIAISVNYYLVGTFDHLANTFKRFDYTFSDFDLWLFGSPPALIFEKWFSNELLRKVVYDVIMSGYFLYYVLPYYVAIVYYFKLPKGQKHRLGRFFASIIIYYSLNYLFYILVPVSGPQYYISDMFQTELLFTPWGDFLFGVISGGQGTFIDCFPSGHAGIAFLTTFWLYKINSFHRYICLVVSITIVIATVALRFHYTLDIVAAIPLALFSYWLGRYMYHAK